MEIKLQKLELTNFMKFRGFTFEPNGKNAVLRGDNKTGKTTSASAFSWLLFDKDVHQNATKFFSIKTTDKNDRIIPGIDHTVEAELLIDGKPLKLKKTYREVWSKKRKVLKSHKTDYWIDDIPDIKKKDYIAKIAEIIPEETFRLLTDINYFNSEKFGWQNRRKILFQLCEGLSEEALDTAEKAKKILASKKKTINEKKDGIQPRIDEKNRDLAAIADYNKAEIQARITDFDKQIQDIKTDSSRFALLKEQAELETTLSQVRASQAADRLTATSGLRAEIEKIEDDYAKAKFIISDISLKIGVQGGIIGVAEREIDGLYADWDRITTDEPDILDLCPTCSKPFLPEEKELIRTEFNLQQSKKKEGINQAGKLAKSKKEKAEKEKTKQEDDLKLEQTDIIKIEENLRKKKAELSAIILPAGRSEKDKKAMAIQKRIEKIENTLSQDDQDQNTETLEANLATERAKIAKIDARADHKARIVELGEQEKSLSAEIEKLEADLFKAEENIQEQARLLEKPINAKFNLVKFQLFEEQMNLGVRPCCKTLIDGIEYSHGLNTGSEIEADCEIVAVLQKHFGISCPVFLDHKESITKDIKMPCQLISLIVDPKYKKLHIIVDE